MGGEGDKAGHGTKDIENYFTGSMQDCSEIFHRKIEKSGVKIPGSVQIGKSFEINFTSY